MSEATEETIMKLKSDTYESLIDDLVIFQERTISPHMRATLDAWSLLDIRVPYEAPAASEADSILLDAMRHLLVSIGL